MSYNGPHRRFTTHQLNAISITERACSAVSVAASCLIIITFLGSKSFRKPINRLVFYASFGNILTNVGTLVSQSGIANGPHSSLCQFQAFVIQWFMPADSLWAFSMACNVYLALFHHYNTEHLRPLEWKYFLLCYGVPFIPAFAFLFIETRANGRVYGLAVQWCWVSLSWDYLQIAVFYGPVWFVIFLTFAIYARVGIFIFQQRRRLQKYTHTGSTFSTSLPVVNHGQQTQTADSNASTNASTNSTTSTTAGAHSRYPLNEYPVGERDYNDNGGGGGDEDWGSRRSWHPRSLGGENGAEELGMEEALQEGGELQEGPLDMATSTTPEAVAAWAYSKYAVLFFIALLITWVPSSVNRIYAFSRHDNLFGLTYASSFVLPLQGFWNSAIYVTVSWRSFKTLPHEITHIHIDPHDLAHRTNPVALAGKVKGRGRRVWDWRGRVARGVRGKFGY